MHALAAQHDTAASDPVWRGVGPVTTQLVPLSRSANGIALPALLG
jgi:hypothetical protein